MKQLFQINFHIFRDPIEYSFDIMDDDEDEIYGPVDTEDLDPEEIRVVKQSLETLQCTIKAMEQNETNKTPY